MSKPSKPSKQYRILNSDGTYGFISRHRAKACLRAGYAIEVREKVIQFFKPAVEEPVSRPAWGPTFEVIPASLYDSGQDGFLRYPMACGITSSPRFPGLARINAGLG